MSMLAEPRSRQKWSEDPRNTRWACDKSKYGYQMLTKMGWSEGKGLGQNENGKVSHIKLKKKKNMAGFGMNKSNDDDWISQQDDFNSLLLSLNQGAGNPGERKISSLEARVKMSRKKILYTKFVKSKDLSNASSEDLASIFGQRSKSAPATPQLSDDDAHDSDCSCASCPTTATTTEKNEKAEGFITVNSGVSIADYFASKMAAKKAALVTTTNNTENIDEDENDSKTTKKKKKKRKRQSDSDDEEDDGIVFKVKKKKSRQCVNEDENNENTSDTINKDFEDGSKTKKKKKKKEKESDDSTNSTDAMQNDSHESNSCTDLMNVDSPAKKLSKKKKVKSKHCEVNSEGSQSLDERNETRKKKKKKKNNE